MTYATSETDLMHIAKFTAASSKLYSVSGFFIGVLVNIFISYGVTSEKLGPLADFWLHKGSYLIAIAAGVCFLFGHGFTRDKNEVIDQIRSECGVDPKRTAWGIIHGWFMRQVERRFQQAPRSQESTKHD